MESGYVLSLADDAQATLETVGGKGASLARLSAAGLPVPGGFHVTTRAYRQFVAGNDLQGRILAALEGADVSRPDTLETASQAIRDLFDRAQMPPEVAGAIARAYAELSGTSPTVAVRSSATAEDLPDLSFAGQQETFLNVQGVEAVLDAVRRCWASLWTARAIGYRIKHAVDQSTISLAAVVQTLVPAEAAGVLFTANPINGRRDQAVISATWGLGEAVVGGLVTPDMLTVDKRSGEVLERETADKQVMTVRVAAEGGTGDGTQEQPVPEALRRAPVLDGERAAELTQLGVRIEDLYGVPMDIEWALADGAFAILQARPITALPEPEAPAIQVPPPAGWELPDPKGHYMRASIIELMPDPLSPLFVTMGLGAIGRGIQKMIKGVFGAPPETLPADLLCTINGYAYMAVNFTPKQWWLMLVRMVPTFGRVFRHGVTYWRETAHAEYAAAVARWREQRLADLSPTELLTGVGDVLAAFGHHLGSLMASTMGPAAGSEALFTRVYERLVKRESDPSAPTFLMGFDSMPIRAEKALYDLAMWCRERDTLAAYLSGTSAERIVSHLADGTLPPGVDAEQRREWTDRFRGYLDRYGYSIYDLDFARPLPMDEPAPTLETLKLFISGRGKDPYERQQAYAGRREQAVRSVKERLRGFKRWAFEKTLSWAQGLAPLREDGIVEIGLGYPLLRRMLRELGRRLVEAGAIEERDDIYWLQRDEVEQAAADLERGVPLPNRMAAVRQRRAEWRACKRLTPPPQLPLKAKLLGMVDTDIWLAARAEETQTGDTVEGLGASPGQVTARARVIRGPEDFGQMQPGEVLVASITTPAWTPLFAMAAAVVTDIGGPLSHGSIVAREYGIPAVLGTGVATRRIHSGQMITVDGSAGTVVLAK